MWEIAVLLSSIDRTFSPSREDSLSSKKRETFTIYCHDRSLKIKYPKYPKYRFVALDRIFFFFFISLLEEEHNEISRNKSVCGTEHEILFILILLFFTVAVPPRPRNAGFQPPFPAETRFPDRESACESVTTEPRWNANDEKKYR